MSKIVESENDEKAQLETGRADNSVSETSSEDESGSESSTQHISAESPADFNSGLKNESLTDDDDSSDNAKLMQNIGIIDKVKIETNVKISENNNSNNVITEVSVVTGNIKENQVNPIISPRQEIINENTSNFAIKKAYSGITNTLSEFVSRERSSKELLSDMYFEVQQPKKDSNSNSDSDSSSATVLIPAISSLFRLHSSKFNEDFSNINLMNAKTEKEKDKNKIIIKINPRITLSTFLWIEKYIYGLEPPFNTDSKESNDIDSSSDAVDIVNLLLFTLHYELTTLKDACIKKISEIILANVGDDDNEFNAGRVCNLVVRLEMDELLKHECDAILSRCNLFEANKGRMILESPEFLRLPEIMVFKLIERDDLYVEEIRIWKKCEEWTQKHAEIIELKENGDSGTEFESDSEAKKKEESDDDKTSPTKSKEMQNLKSEVQIQMRKFAKYIRFQRMTEKQLGFEVSDSGVFTSNEILALIRHKIEVTNVNMQSQTPTQIEAMKKKITTNPYLQFWDVSAALNDRPLPLEKIRFNVYPPTCVSVDGNRIVSQSAKNLLISSTQGWTSGRHSWKIKFTNFNNVKKCCGFGIISSISKAQELGVYMCQKGVPFVAYCIEVTTKFDYRMRASLNGIAENLFNYKTQTLKRIDFDDVITATLDLDKHTFQITVEKDDANIKQKEDVKVFKLPPVSIQNNLKYYPCIDCDGGSHCFIINP